MGHLTYTRVRRRCYGTRGFLLNSKRFSVQRLRAKFFNFFRILMRTWRSHLFDKKTTMSRGKPSDGSRRRNLVAKENVHRADVYRLKSFGRSNSEAIADCLEFIKRSSVSLDDKQEIYATDKL